MHRRLFLALSSVFLIQVARAADAPSSEITPPPLPETTPAATNSTPAISETVTATAMATPLATPTERLSYNSCNVDGPYIAITFDDGPHPVLTPKLLDMLKARGIKATFFLIGQNAAEYPDIVKRIAAEGHELGNHSWSHPQLTKLAPDALRDQIAKTANAITDATGHPPTVMRPPYGATTPYITQWIYKEFGTKVIMWSVDPLDWKIRKASHVESVIVSQTRPGSIILAHDIHASTVAAMPETLDKLKAKGFQFLTVSELMAKDKPLPPPTPKPSATPKATESQTSSPAEPLASTPTPLP